MYAERSGPLRQAPAKAIAAAARGNDDDRNKCDEIDDEEEEEGDVKDLLLYDLKQENTILRTELQALYIALAECTTPPVATTGLQTDRGVEDISTADLAIQTDGEGEATLMQKKIERLESELLQERNLCLEHARQAREMDCRLREQEGKLLAQNLQMMRTLPLNKKLQEIQQRNDAQHLQLHTMTQENVRQELQLKNQAAEIERFAFVQREEQERILQLNNDNSALRRSLSGTHHRQLVHITFCVYGRAIIFYTYISPL